MNIEELKMILETINATTGLAKDMGTTWIWLHYGFKFLINLTALAGVAVVAYAVYRVARVLRSDCIDTVFMRRCRDKLKTGNGGSECILAEAPELLRPGQLARHLGV